MVATGTRPYIRPDGTTFDSWLYGNAEAACWVRWKGDLICVVRTQRSPVERFLCVNSDTGAVWTTSAAKLRATVAADALASPVRLTEDDEPARPPARVRR